MAAYAGQTHLQIRARSVRESCAVPNHLLQAVVGPLKVSSPSHSCQVMCCVSRCILVPPLQRACGEEQQADSAAQHQLQRGSQGELLCTARHGSTCSRVGGPDVMSPDSRSPA
jgi:hypothetical protein